jgi:uncharacterized protein
MRASKPPEISPNVVRLMALGCQGLLGRPKSPIDGSVLLDVVKQIGLLQLDSISVVDRSHYLVMFSRVGKYDRRELDQLLYPKRELFEQWAHAACLIPSAAYEYFQPVFLRRRRKPLRYGRERALGPDPTRVLQDVMREVGERGPLGSRDFDESCGSRRSWWNRKPARVALDVLFYEGRLMVDRRVNFQSRYDLPRRVRRSASGRTRTLQDYRLWATRKSVACLGVATVRQIADYYRQNTGEVNDSVKYLVSEGHLAEVSVGGWSEEAFTLTANLSLLNDLAAGTHCPEVTTFLSPFDNLIWDRQRTQTLFNFNYRAEMYTPPDRRTFGYYAMPLLHRGRLIARADIKVDRTGHVLEIRAVRLEEGVRLTDDVVEAVAMAAKELADFCDVNDFLVERAEPKGLRGALVRRLKGGIRDDR